MAMAGHMNWKFVQVAQDQVPEEVVLRIQGIVCSRELPPIRRLYEMYVFCLFIVFYFHKVIHILSGRKPNRHFFMQQSVMLTGLSLSMFDKALDSVHAIQDMFQQHMMDGTMEDWAPSVFQEHASIDVSNWYFTPHQNAMLDCHISSVWKLG